MSVQSLSMPDSLPPPGDPSDAGIEYESPVFPALAGGFSTAESPGRSSMLWTCQHYPRWSAKEEISKIQSERC